MTTDKIDPSKRDTTISFADDLTKTTNKSAELSEEELKRASGGRSYEYEHHYGLNVTGKSL